MIQITRLPEPKVLATNKADWLKELHKAIASKDLARIKICQKKYGHKKVKEELELMFSEKCAYCESHINIITTGHIEHFRPKSRFKSQTFEWLNLLLSCPNCNNKQHKGDKFPSVHSGGRLINPTIEDPGAHFDFTFDAITQQTLAIPKTDRGKTTAQIFGLNNRKALIKARSSLIKKLIVIKTYAATDPAAKKLIAEAKKQDQPYLAWVNALI
ncbi:MAG: TIGR02646 family protein [Alcaligenaceae bacterium]|nr:MAG: TIGR02646 family protein [Alcaligenaceae bacterium]